MNIPKKCEGCREVAQIAEAPVTGFIERIERVTGKKVASWGGNAMRPAGSMPDYVGFYEGGLASERVISQAWFATEGEMDSKERQVAELCGGCPGLLEGRVETEAGTAIVPICGKTALQAAQQTT